MWGEIQLCVREYFGNMVFCSRWRSSGARHSCSSRSRSRRFHQPPSPLGVSPPRLSRWASSSPFARQFVAGWRKYWRLGIITGIANIVIPFILIPWGETHIPSGTASILNATTPLFTVILANWWIGLGHETLTARRALSVLVGFVGVAVTIGPRRSVLSVTAPMGLLASWPCSSPPPPTALAGCSAAALLARRDWWGRSVPRFPHSSSPGGRRILESAHASTFAQGHWRDSDTRRTGHRHRLSPVFLARSIMSAQPAPRSSPTCCPARR